MIQTCVNRIYLITLVLTKEPADIRRLIFHFNNKDLIPLVIMSIFLYCTKQIFQKAFLCDDLSFTQTMRQ